MRAGDFFFFFLFCITWEVPSTKLSDEGGVDEQRTRLLRLMDQRYKGIAHDVGQSEILGRIHVALIKIGNNFYPCSFVVLDSPNMEFLFGMDMLRKHQRKTSLPDFWMKNVFRMMHLALEQRPGTECGAVNASNGYISAHVYGVKEALLEDPEDEKKTSGEAEARPVSYSYSFFHIICALASMYGAMLLSGWTDSSKNATLIDVGWTSV
ncbi:predicted protein [Arabidopsis lyrata subsp. lyrata]|uniref:Predicted protein n=1 Tax=Arabidopsis lyrata subsp. lyrata TaxID=81972 RepID=D7LN02_ARALL|nr:predicted protein [Arabidopsis lyrata subsp. lyrata]